MANIGARSGGAGSGYGHFSFREDRVYSNPPRSERAKAVRDLLAPFQRHSYLLAPAMPGLEKFAAAALETIGVHHARVHAWPLALMKEGLAAAPYVLRDHAKAGIRNSFEATVSQTLPAMLSQATGWTPDMSVLSRRGVGEDLFAGIIEGLDAATGSMLPSTVLEILPRTIGFGLMAIATGDEKHAKRIDAFLRLFRGGNVPVGLISNGTFLVLTK